MTTQRQGVGLHLHVYTKNILEKEKLNKLCEMKEEIRKAVVGSDLFLRNNNKGHTDNTQVSIRTTLLLCPEVPSELQVEHLLLLWYLLWNNNTENT